MDVVPVIDLKGGLVVHARQGARDSYEPLRTPLSPSSEPADVVSGLLRLYPFRRIYIADLDAIEQRGSHTRALAHLAARFPALELWVDSGVNDSESAAAFLRQGSFCLVLGSESQHDTRLLGRLRGDGRLILSLDFRGEAFQGPPRILAEPALWPARVIAMTLAQVGAGRGPDIEQVRAIKRAAEEKKVYAAGGVRDAADLEALALAGAAGVLVATALHAGTLSRDDLAKAGRD